MQLSYFVLKTFWISCRKSLKKLTKEFLNRMEDVGKKNIITFSLITIIKILILITVIFQCFFPKFMIATIWTLRTPRLIFHNSRSSHPEVFLEKGVLKICSKFTGEHSCRIWNHTSAWVFSCKFAAFFQNTLLFINKFFSWNQSKLENKK